MRTSGEGPFVRWMGWKACDDLCVTVHEVAAEGFGSEAEVYERSRPTYPADAVAWVVENLRLQPGVTVADVAAGTGKLTRLLEPSGAYVIGVEPVGGMLA